MPVSKGLAKDSELSHLGFQGLGFMPDPPKPQTEGSGHLRFRASVQGLAVQRLRVSALDFKASGFRF